MEERREKRAESREGAHGVTRPTSPISALPSPLFRPVPGEFGAWNFFGVWDLGFGASPGLHFLRRSHTSPPNNNTAPGMPASRIHCAVCNCDLVITSLYSLIGLGPSSSSNCVRSSNQLTA